MRATVQIGSYNERRYSRPWIAVVTEWPVGGKPELRWGGYCGDDSGGELEIEAMPGDIIRWGQRDGRGNGGTNEWEIMQADGKLNGCTQAEARVHFETRSTRIRLEKQGIVDGKAQIAARVTGAEHLTDDALLAEIRRRGLTVKTEQII